MQPDASGRFFQAMVEGGGNEIDLLLASESFGEIPVQLPLPILIEGIHQVEDGQTRFAAIVTADVDEVIDLPAEPLPTLPLELPTVLPPGELAGVLLNLTPTTATGLLTITGQLEAIADNALPGDVNGDGLDDLIIGAPYADVYIGNTKVEWAGISYVV